MIYPTILAAVFGLLVYSLGHRTPVEVTVLRQTGAPFQMLADGRVVDQHPHQAGESHRRDPGLPGHARR
jgi:hypothetical protein